jgi:hypothetical protein
MGHKSKGRSKGRRASCSPCTDVSPPDGGFARGGSRLGECGEVTSIIGTDVGAFGANGTSESRDSGSALVVVEPVGVGRMLTTVAVTVVTEGTLLLL